MPSRATSSRPPARRFVDLVSVTLLLLGLVASACASDGPDTVGTERQVEGADSSYAEFCGYASEAAIYAETNGQDLAGYADLLDQAAATAPEPVVDYYAELASFTRDLDVDPTAEGTADRAGALFESLLPTARWMQANCDLDLFDPTGSGAGISISGGSSSSGTAAPQDAAPAPPPQAATNEVARLAEVVDDFAANLDASNRRTGSDGTNLQGRLTLRGERDVTELSYLCQGLRRAADDADFDRPVLLLVEDDSGNQHSC